MNISWGADTTITECSIEYTLTRDTQWKIPHNDGHKSFVYGV